MSQCESFMREMTPFISRYIQKKLSKMLRLGADLCFNRVTDFRIKESLIPQYVLAR